MIYSNFFFSYFTYCVSGNYFLILLNRIGGDALLLQSHHRVLKLNFFYAFEMNCLVTGAFLLYFFFISRYFIKYFHNYTKIFVKTF